MVLACRAVTKEAGLGAELQEKQLMELQRIEEVSQRYMPGGLKPYWWGDTGRESPDVDTGNSPSWRR